MDHTIDLVGTYINLAHLAYELGDIKESASFARKAASACSTANTFIILDAHFFWRTQKAVIKNFLQKWTRLARVLEDLDDNFEHPAYLFYKKLAAAQTISTCDKVIIVVEHALLPSSHLLSLNLQIFYNKIKAECFKYKTQVTQGAEYYEATGLSILAYSDAQLVANRFPHSFIHPEFLKISIAIAWFYHDIYHNKMAAIYFARAISSRAVEYLENYHHLLPEERLSAKSLCYMADLQQLIIKWEEELGVEDVATVVGA